MSASSNMEGFEELLSELRRRVANADRVENAALRAGARPIQEEAARLAPRSDSDKEHLADNIAISNVKTKDGVKYIEVGPRKGDNGKFFYGKFPEWGTSKMTARPFMGPAAAIKEEESKEAIKDALKRGLGLD